MVKLNGMGRQVPERNLIQEVHLISIIIFLLYIYFIKMLFVLGRANMDNWRRQRATDDDDAWRIQPEQRRSEKWGKYFT